MKQETVPARPAFINSAEI